MDEEWEVAAKRAADACGVAVTVVPVGAEPDAARYHDADGAWAAVRGIADGGAVLVRPDNHIAWRGGEGADEDLTAVLRRILGHHDTTTTRS